MRRVFIIGLGFVMMLAMSGPVSAAKGGGGRGGGNELTYLVTMTGDLATTCAQGVAASEIYPGEVTPIEMTGWSRPAERSLHAAGANLAVDLEIGWSRVRDAGWGYGGDALTGCHGLSESALATDSYAGTLSLTRLSGDELQLRWLFDYGWEFGNQGKRAVQEWLEFLEVITEVPFDSSSTESQRVTGVMTLRLFTKQGKDIVSDWVVIDTVPVTFTLQIVPAS